MTTSKTEITAATVKKLAAKSLIDDQGNLITTITDDRLRGFQARLQPSGKVRYTYRFKLPGRPQRELKLGLEGEKTAKQAHALAFEASQKVGRGIDPVAERKTEVAAATKQAANTVNAVLDRYLDDRGPTLRCLRKIKAVFDDKVRPVLGTKNIHELEREDITSWRKGIPGRAAGDTYWRYLKAALNWWADNYDARYRPPRVKPLVSVKAMTRKRKLNEDEVRDLWRALAELGGASEAYPRFVRALVLTAQRRSTVATMHADEIGRDGWVIPAAKMKGKEGETNDHLVHVTGALREQLGNGAGYLFSNDGGKTPLGSLSNRKAKLDAKIGEIREREGRGPMPEWRYHDLRRTARSFLSRFTTADIAERVLAHEIGGVRGIYDLHAYQEEKADALERLAAHITSIVTTPPDNVVPIGSRTTRAAASAA